MEGKVVERPLLFSASMVRAILEGRKTQTRRAIKPQPFYCSLLPNPIFPKNERERAEQSGLIWPNVKEEILERCPSGKPGDRLWVRETFGMTVRSVGGTPHEKLCYRADNGNEVYAYGACGNEVPVKWKPSIHMPRWASRITLEITGVRVERLKEIGEADAAAEGIFFTDYGRKCYHGGRLSDVGSCPGSDETHPQRNGWSWKETTSSDQCLGSAKLAFANLWESINGAGSWAANPWVWVIEFKRVAP